MIEPLVARRVQLVGFDVDGVLTDGSYFLGVISGQMAEWRRFEARDDLGVQMLRSAGIKVVLLAGRSADTTRMRADALAVDDVVQDDQGRKLPAFEGMLLRLSVRMEDAAFLGCDLQDLPVLRRVGLAAVVADAAPELRGFARFTTTAVGGRGAVREFSETLLRARGQWDDLVQQYLTERGEPAARSSRAIRMPGVR